MIVILTAWKVSKYGVISGPYFPTFGLNTERYGVHSWRVLEKYSSKTSTEWKVSKCGVISGPHFAAFGLNTERYEVSLRIQSECRKTRTRNDSVFGHIGYYEKLYSRDLDLHGAIILHYVFYKIFRIFNIQKFGIGNEE